MAKTAVCIGTGPSLTGRQIDVARAKGFTLFGCNNVYQLVPDLEVLYACNLEWWQTYWPQGVEEHEATKWTTNENAAVDFGINHMSERQGMGLCEHPGIIHHGHGSGYSLVGMAHKYGYERILLIGYDLKYAPDYDGSAKRIGSDQRHYFGEYPEHLQHWPSTRVKGGIHTELLELYESVHKQGLVEIINCTPESALCGVIPSQGLDDVEP